MAGVASAIAGAVQGRNAVWDAAHAQMNATKEAGDLVGQSAADNLPGLQTAYNNAADDVLASSTQAGNYGSEAGRAAGDAATAAATKAAAGMNDAAAAANGLLNPYMSAGTDALSKIADIIAAGNGAFQLQDDPGYQLRQKESQQAIERAAAAKGGLMSGATMKAIQDRSQALASDETDRAFARFNTGRQASLSTLGNLVNVGMTANTTAGRNLTGAAQYTGDVGTRAAEYAGNARMQGDMYAGDMLYRGTTAATGLRTRAADTTFGTMMDVNRYKADMALQRGNAEAAGHIGAANQWNQMYSTIGRTGDSMMFGGMMGGGGGGGTFGGMMPPQSGMTYGNGRYGRGWYR